MNASKLVDTRAPGTIAAPPPVSVKDFRCPDRGTGHRWLEAGQTLRCAAPGCKYTRFVKGGGPR
jgi:hypothetical protein